MRLLKPLSAVRLTLFSLIAWLAGAGCSKNQTAPPQALAPEQVAPTIETAFKEAQPEVKEAANEVVSAMQNNDDPRALAQLQALSVQPNLTPEQRRAAALSTMSVLARLQIAAANGSKVAEEMLKKYRASK